MNFKEVLEIDCYTYRILFKDAYINMLRQTEEGTDYLHKAWILTQKTPDKESLRKQFNA